MRVVNIRQEQATVFIGRPTALGNPFVIGRDGTREEVIAKYRTWLWSEWNRAGLASDVWYAINRLNDSDTLGCFCKDEACHGDVIVNAWKWLHEIQ